MCGALGSEAAKCDAADLLQYVFSQLYIISTKTVSKLACFFRCDISKPHSLVNIIMCTVLNAFCATTVLPDCIPPTLF